MNPSLHIGPMSKNVVDSIIELNVESGKNIGLIPSRRQIDVGGGYANNWTTKSFFEYVEGKALITRDHGGPNQGFLKDDGFDSLSEDAKYFDIIHIDPWKQDSTLKEGIKSTARYINYVYNLNPNILFEVGTEQSIFPYSALDLNYLFLEFLQQFYHVIQLIGFLSCSHFL